ncbi:MAG: hypothetical protein AAGM27_09025 [Cyanobacteria bacterium J06554_3]
MEITSAVSEAYQYVTDKLSLNDRLRLATLLLNDVTKVEVAIVDKSDFWTSQDQKDVGAFALSYAADIFPDDEGLI